MAGRAAAGLSQRVHPKIKERIYDMVDAGVRDAKEMKKMLELEVNDTTGHGMLSMTTAFVPFASGSSFHGSMHCMYKRGSYDSLK